MTEKEFKVSENIVLRLEEGNTNIYINNELFQQCKHLFLINPQLDYGQSEINSVDEASEVLSSDLERKINSEELGITPEMEFWGHCSNLQAWTENDYDTRILHINLAFPLLKELKQKGDVMARKMFRKEVIERYSTGIKSVQTYLIENGYMNDFSLEEMIQLSLNDENNRVFENIANESGISYRDLFHLLGYEKGRIKKVVLYSTNLIPPSLLKIKKHLEILIIGRGLKSIPSWIGRLDELKELKIRNCEILELPESIGKLKKLEKLNLEHNSLKFLPESIGKLSSLIELDVGDNKLDKLPNSIGELEQLKKFHLDRNDIKTLPDSLGDIKGLTWLTLDNNKLKFLPLSVKKLKKLEWIGLVNNPVKKIQNWIYDLPNLKYIHIDEKLKNITKFDRGVEIRIRNR